MLATKPSGSLVLAVLTWDQVFRFVDISYLLLFLLSRAAKQVWSSFP